MKSSSFLILSVAVAACASASNEERESLLGQPINCDVAEADIAALKAAKPARGERALSAVKTATPVGAVASVLTGSYRDSASVLIGRTNRELDARIVEIRTTCDLPGEQAEQSAQE
jgi:hypothetical protein